MIHILKRSTGPFLSWFETLASISLEAHSRVEEAADMIASA
jgi:hypothetical protein